MLKKLDSFLFIGVNVSLYFFWLYGLTLYAPNHPVTLFFWIAGIIISLTEVIFKICNCYTSKQIKRYVKNF